MDIVTSYFVSVTGLGFLQYGILLYIVCVTCSRMIVLYPRYTVNWGTNIFVIITFVIDCPLFPFPCVWALCWAFPNLWGVPRHAFLFITPFLG